MLSMMTNAAMTRDGFSKVCKKLHFVYVDEFANFIAKLLQVSLASFSRTVLGSIEALALDPKQST